MLNQKNLQYNSIVHLFQRLDSNLSKYSSLKSSPQKQADKSCLCMNVLSNKNLEIQFYKDQKCIFTTASQQLHVQGQQNLSKLLHFIIQYLTKIDELYTSFDCVCRNKLTQALCSQEHKISFLRQQNYKFFKLVEEKTAQCQKLRQKIQKMQRVSLSEGSNSFEIDGSKISSSNISSRISECKQKWNEGTMPTSQLGHRKYFNEISQNIQCLMNQNSEVNKSNISTNYYQNSHRKGRIFNRC